jgi:Xaa-Pro aminopeptidase
MDYVGRQLRLSTQLAEKRLPAMLITHLPNVRYLCGFTGSAAILAVAVAGKRPRLALFTDGRYTEQARLEVQGAKVVIARGGALREAAGWLARNAEVNAKVGFEADHFSFSAYESLRKLASRLKWQPTSQLVERLRAVKEPAEIAQIRAAIDLASQVYDSIVADIRPGILETAIAAELEFVCRRMGAERMSFETIVASGTRSALPHGIASTQPIAANGFVIIDFGVVLGGYCSDMTRTVFVGQPNRRAERIYQAVLNAQLAGIKAVTAGLATTKVDYAARKVLEKAGLGEYFTHSTGHGVGIEIHELPGLRRATKTTKPPQPERLEAGMVVTIEPGVYIPGYGGVRIEDMVLVTDTGCEVLTPNSKELIVL